MVLTLHTARRTARRHRPEWLLLGLALLVGAVPLQRITGRATLQSERLLHNEPYLLQQAVEQGIWPGDTSSRDPEVLYTIRPSELYEQYFDRYRIHHQANPYYQRGDFDGDGLTDLAVTIREKETWKSGIAVVPATLDTVYLFGAGIGCLAGNCGAEVGGLYVPRGDPPERLVIGLEEGKQIELAWLDGRFRLSSEPRVEPLPGEPALVSGARSTGLWPEGIRFEIVTDLNPFYVRGDFDGDGRMDVAVKVRDTSNREKGLVIVPGTLDRLFPLFRRTVDRGITNAGFIRVIGKGTVLRPFSEEEEKPPPIPLVGDALEAGWMGAPYGGAFYWRAGRFHWVTLSD